MRNSDSLAGSSCLVTGTTGFIGSHLAERLACLGAEVKTTGRESSASSGDLTNPRNVKRIFANASFTFVFHLAAQSGVGLSWKDPQGCFRSNVGATFNLLQALKESDNPAAPFVFTSSSSVYGSTKVRPIPESAPLKPVSPYGVTKECAEVLCRSYNSAFGLHTKIARPFYVTGPGCKRGVVCEIAQKITLAESGRYIRRDIELENPDVILDVVDVRDCVTALEVIAGRGKDGEVYNISSGEGRSVKEIAEAYIALSGANLTPKRGGEDRRSDTLQLVGNPSKLKSLGWTRRYTFEDTLRGVLESCRSTTGA